MIVENRDMVKFGCPKCLKVYNTFISLSSHIRYKHHSTYPELTGEKWCPSCKEFKQVFLFYTNIAFKSGYSSMCKECSHKLTKVYSQTEKGYLAHLKADLKITRRYKKAKRIVEFHQKRTWELTEEEYTSIVSNPCTYCSLPFFTTGSGLDRIENSKDYTKGNVVSCCPMCNSIKSDLFTYEEMKELGETVRQIKIKRMERQLNSPLNIKGV